MNSTDIKLLYDAHAALNSGLNNLIDSLNKLTPCAKSKGNIYDDKGNITGTYDNEGYLHEMKILVGSNTDLGKLIASLGGKVRNAATYGIVDMKKTCDVMKAVLDAQWDNIANTENDINEIQQEIDDIDFLS